jgi:hypothetical protein
VRSAEGEVASMGDRCESKDRGSEVEVAKLMRLNWEPK